MCLIGINGLWPKLMMMMNIDELLGGRVWMIIDPINVKEVLASTMIYTKRITMSDKSKSIILGYKFHNLSSYVTVDYKFYDNNPDTYLVKLEMIGIQRSTTNYIKQESSIVAITGKTSSVLIIYELKDDYWIGEITDKNTGLGRTGFIIDGLDGLDEFFTWFKENYDKEVQSE